MMSKTLALVLATAALSAPLPVFAQAPAPEPATPPAAGAPAEPAGADAQQGGEVVENYGTVIEAIAGLEASPTDLSTVTDAEGITIILLSTLQGDPNHDANAVDTAIMENQAAIDAFRMALAGNEAIVARLMQEGLMAEQALAIAANAEGDLRLYVDDREDA